jgi:hypothetical protein
MMLVTVLCSFSVLIGKHFLKKTQHCLGRKRSTSLPAYVAAISDSLCCYRLNSEYKLIRAMLPWSSCVNAPGFETKNPVTFFRKEPKFRIIPLLGKKVSSRNRCQTNEALTQLATKLGGIA